MTPDEVAKNFYGECALPDDSKGWCVIHESRWPSMTHQYCKEMTDLVDLAEQAVEAYQADLRVRVEALPIWETSPGWLVMSYKDVLALINRSTSDPR